MQFIRNTASRLLIGGAVLALSMVPGVARADSVQVILDGSPLVFDVPPAIVENVTMVPVRAVLTPLGASFAWHQESQTVVTTLRETVIEAQVGSPTALVNGRPISLTRPVEVREGRAMIPLRFFAEQLGFAVDWDGETRTVLLSSSMASPAGDGSEIARSEHARAATVSREAENRTVEQVVALAAQAIGLPYAWGGTSPETGFDCSGFITYLSEQVGVALPRTSYEQFAAGVAVAQADLAAGDLVSFTTYAPGASHVGIYDGAGGFIHAQSPELGVVRTPLSSPWWSSRYIGARRVFR